MKSNIFAYFILILSFFIFLIFIFLIISYNIIKYCSLPFASVEKMNATIINNLVKSIKKGDVLYYLGDLTFKPEVALKIFDNFGLSAGIFVHT